MSDTYIPTAEELKNLTTIFHAYLDEDEGFEDEDEDEDEDSAEAEEAEDGDSEDDDCDCDCDCEDEDSIFELDETLDVRASYVDSNIIIIGTLNSNREQFYRSVLPLLAYLISDSHDYYGMLLVDTLTERIVAMALSISINETYELVDTDKYVQFMEEDKKTIVTEWLNDQNQK